MGVRLTSFAIFVLAVSVGCERTPPAEQPPPAPEVTLYGVKMQHYQESQLAAFGRAAKVTYGRTSGDLTAYESFFRFPNRHGVTQARSKKEPPSAELRAPMVVGSLSSRQADATGGVLLKSSQGLTGATERFHFDGLGPTAHGEERITVTGPGLKMSADRFAFDFASEDFVFDGQVRTDLEGRR